MLNFLREGVKSNWLVKGFLFSFLLMALGGLVFMDVRGFFTGGGVGLNTVIKVDDKKLGPVQFDRALQNLLAQQGMTVDTARRMGMLPAYAESVGIRLQTEKAAEDLGLHPSKERLTSDLRKILEEVKLGSETKKQAVERILAESQISEQQLLDSVASDIGIDLMRRSILSGATAMMAPYESAYTKLQSQTRDFGIVRLSDSSAAPASDPTENELKELYNEKLADFSVPAEYNLILTTFGIDDVAGETTLTDEELQDLYDADQYAEPEKRTFNQYIFKTEGEAENAISVVENESVSLEEAGKTAGASAANFSTITAEKDKLPDMIGEDVFAASQGDIVGPLQSPIGFHVIELTEITAAQQKTFEEVKEQIRAEEEKMAREDLLFEMLDAIEDAVLSGETVQAIADTYALNVSEPVKMIPALSQEDEVNKAALAKLEEIGLTTPEDKIASLLSLTEGQNASVFEITPTEYAVVRLKETKAVEVTPFEDVRAEIVAIWENQSNQKNNEARALKLRAELEDGNKDLGRVGRMTESRSEGFTNIAQDNQDISPAILQVVFNATEFPTYDVVRDGTDYVIIETRGVQIDTESDVALDDEQSTALQTIIERQRWSTYTQAIGEKYPVKVNTALLEQMYPATSAE